MQSVLFGYTTDLTTDLTSNFGITSMLNHTINCVTKSKFVVWYNMEAISKSDIKFDIRFDISIKPTTWIGHEFDRLKTN